MDICVLSLFLNILPFMTKEFLKTIVNRFYLLEEQQKRIEKEIQRKI